MATAPKAALSAAAISEHEKGLAEVREAHNSILESAGEATTAIAQQIGVLTEDQNTAFRNRAARQRKQGVAALSKRFSGVASLMMPVKLNERSIGSSFQRNFANIENGIYTIGRRAEMFMSEAAALKVMETIQNMITTMENDLETTKAGADMQYDIAKSGKGFMVPTYTGSSADHMVQLRTQLSLRVLRVIEGYDAVICTLQALHWNQVIEANFIDNTELAAKKSVQGLARFIATTLRGMFNRGTAGTAGAQPAANSPTIEAAAA